MPIIISIILRIIYYVGVSILGFRIGLTIAFGADSGLNPFVVFAAIFYLLTFIPALLLGVLPFKIITKPPFALKIYYGWIILLTAISTVGRIYGFSKAMIEAVISDVRHPSGTVCFQVLDAPPDTKVWIDMGFPPKTQLTRFGGVPRGSEKYCAGFGTENPLQIQVYSATESNKKNNHATDEDQASKPFTIPVLHNRKTCIGIFLNNSSNTIKWVPRIVNCSQLRD